MTVTVTMLQTRRGEDGNLWLAGQSYAASDSFASILIGSNLATGVLEAEDGIPVLTASQVDALNDGNILDSEGGLHALSEAQTTQALTATGTAFTGACEFRGIVVRAISGTPQTITVYDATSATGTPIATFTVAALGTYYWDGDWGTVGVGNGARRVCATGCHVVISGGTSRTIDVMVA